MIFSSTILIVIFSFLTLSILLLLVFLLVLNSRYRKFMKGLGTIDVENLMHQYVEDLDQLKAYVKADTEKRIIEIEKKMPSVLRNVGMISYNAFEHMGNLMSFSIATLDDKKNGYIVTGIYNRDSSYVYAKEIVEGTPGKELSKEEKEALNKALINC